jgi:hypothetical protein
MTPERCEQYLRRTEFILDLLEREDVPQDLRERALVLLNLNEKATYYAPPVVEVEICEEPE